MLHSSLEAVFIVPFTAERLFRLVSDVFPMIVAFLSGRSFYGSTKSSKPNMLEPQDIYGSVGTKQSMSGTFSC